MIFYLGTHKPQWLARTAVPLFVSRRTLAPRKTFPRAIGPWALDSGGFTELSKFGAWRLEPAAYVELVRRFSREIGGMQWAAPQDWMCEPVMLRKTGLTVAEHQRRTITNFLDLRALAPELPIVPVLQGWAPRDYAKHVSDYAAAGVDLRREAVVGVGTVCRRQGTAEAVRVFDAIDATMRGLPLHGFGFKTLGLSKLQHVMASADSMAWSYRARKAPPLPGHTHKSCANCLVFALEWRARLLDSLTERGAALRPISFSFLDEVPNEARLSRRPHFRKEHRRVPQLAQLRFGNLAA